MVTFLITSVLIVGLIAIAIYLWQKPANSIEAPPLPPADLPRSLFSDSAPVAELPAPAQDDHSELLSRANDGDLSALLDAKGLEVYTNVLDALVLQSSSEAKLLKLASHIAQHNLPINQALAEAMLKCWEASPSAQTTAKMLHSIALSDDAEMYRRAVEQALAFWREGKLPDVSPTELQALFNSEFWVLSSPVRSSGTGFILKRTLSSARRELEGTTNN
jgi:hypothetical protein